MSKLENLWPTPVLYREIDRQDIIDQTLNVIFSDYDLKKPPADFQKENVIENPGLEEFKNKIVKPAFDDWLLLNLNKTLDDFENYKMKGWITGTCNGYNMVNHNHSGAHLSAVFYLFNDSPENNGEIIFFDPRVNANRGYDTDVWGQLFAPKKYSAKAGTCVVFPSFLYHQVTPFSGSMRIALPVDIFF